MGGISVQFHALPSEIVELVADLTEDPLVFISQATGMPTRFMRTDRQTMSLTESQMPRALLFTVQEPKLGAPDLYGFRIENPDALVLEIGRLTERGLEESWLSSKADNKAALKRWRRASKVLLSGMLRGAEAINNSNGARTPMRWHRFTKGAMQMHREGVRILPIAGNTIIQLPVDH